MTPAGISHVLHSGYFHPTLRSWQAERPVTKDMLMYPLFITDDADAEEDIGSFPGIKRWGLARRGVCSCLLTLSDPGRVSVPSYCF